MEPEASPPPIRYVIRAVGRLAFAKRRIWRRVSSVRPINDELVSGLL